LSLPQLAWEKRLVVVVVVVVVVVITCYIARVLLSLYHTLIDAEKLVMHRHIEFMVKLNFVCGT